MKRTFDRTLQVLVWGLAATIAWGVVAMTSWGASRSLLDAGPGYTNALEPLAYLTGALLVAVSGTLLVQRTHAAWRRMHTNRGLRTTEGQVTPPRRRPQPIPTGRTMADLPPRPPIRTPG